MQLNNTLQSIDWRRWISSSSSRSSGGLWAFAVADCPRHITVKLQVWGWLDHNRFGVVSRIWRAKVNQPGRSFVLLFEALLWHPLWRSQAHGRFHQINRFGIRIEGGSWELEREGFGWTSSRLLTFPVTQVTHIPRYLWGPTPTQHAALALFEGTGAQSYRFRRKRRQGAPDEIHLARLFRLC